jgi:phenylalanyl-tRNA synthetase beta subunit
VWPLGDGKKRVTLRFAFNHPDRSLTQDEATAALDRVVTATGCR